LGTFNKTHVSLEFIPLCNVICSVASLFAPKDSTESLLQAKYHWHVNGFYEQILENYESELNILQVIAVYSVENRKRVNDVMILSDICSNASSQRLQELGIADITKHVSRNEFLDFVGRYDSAYIKASEAYLCIMESTGINCITGKAPSLAVIMSEHMALKQHIKSQLMAFVKNKKLPTVSV
jgi:hypothetical protein